MRFLGFLFWYAGAVLGQFTGLRHAWDPITPAARWHQYNRWQEARRRWGMK